MGLILGILNVFVRDVGQIIPVILQVLFWFTPIVYPSSIIPEGYQKYLVYNPLYSIVQAYQQVLVYDLSPGLMKIGLIGVTGLVLLLIGLFLFRRSGPELVDAL